MSEDRAIKKEQQVVMTVGIDVQSGGMHFSKQTPHHDLCVLRAELIKAVQRCWGDKAKPDVHIKDILFERSIKIILPREDKTLA